MSDPGRHGFSHAGGSTAEPLLRLRKPLWAHRMRVLLGYLICLFVLLPHTAAAYKTVIGAPDFCDSAEIVITTSGSKLCRRGETLRIVPPGCPEKFKTVFLPERAMAETEEERPLSYTFGAFDCANEEDVPDCPEGLFSFREGGHFECKPFPQYFCEEGYLPVYTSKIHKYRCYDISRHGDPGSTCPDDDVRTLMNVDAEGSGAALINRCIDTDPIGVNTSGAHAGAVVMGQSAEWSSAKRSDALDDATPAEKSNIPTGVVREAEPFNRNPTLMAQTQCLTAVTNCTVMDASVALAEANECVRRVFSMQGALNDFQFKGDLENCAVPAEARQSEAASGKIYWRWPVCCYKTDEPDNTCQLYCGLFMTE